MGNQGPPTVFPPPLDVSEVDDVADEEFKGESHSNESLDGRNAEDY